MPLARLVAVGLAWIGGGPGQAPQLAITRLRDVPQFGELCLNHRDAFVACNCGRCGLPQVRPA